MNSARFLVFGPKQPANVTIESIVMRKASNVVRRMFGMPPSRGPGFRDWLLAELKKVWAELVGEFFGRPAVTSLPADLPKALFEAVDTTLRNRGGLSNRELETPNYWLDVSGARSGLFAWRFAVDYTPTADPAKVSSFEMALEDAITRAGYDYNVRIGRRPIRIEIDKPNPPMQTLKEQWPIIEEWEIDKDWAAVGVIDLPEGPALDFIQCVDMDFSWFIVGLPRSGKTQESMAVILSMAMLNSPERISMIIIDPKAMDYRYFNRLPHLAMPVINDAEKAESVLIALSKELDRRIASAAKHDMTFIQHKIMVYIDELAELMPKSEKDSELLIAWERLGRMGGAYGFIVIGATQRAFDCHIKAYSKLLVKVVGKMRNANDTSSLGLSSSTAHKLPGRGAFEVYYTEYPEGMRTQGCFVADAKLDDYGKQLGYFFDSINERWNGNRPGWMLPGAPQASETPNATPVINVAPEPATPTLDPAILNALRLECADDPTALSARAVRRIVKEVTGKEPENERAKVIKQQFLSIYATNFAGTR